MLSTPSSKIMDVKEAQSLNERLPKEFTDPGMHILSKDEQFSNKDVETDWSLPERPTSVKEVQPENAKDPILVTLSGRLILIRPVQLRKADSPIVFKPLFKLISQRLLHPAKVFNPIEDKFVEVNVFNALQSLKTLSHSSTILVPKETFVSLVHPENALL